MNFVFWSVPALTVLAAVASGRLNTTQAAALGLLVGIPIVLLTGPQWLGLPGLGQALARGAWIGVTIAPYILGGLFFWQIAARGAGAGAGAAEARAPAGGDAALARRRLLFFACFLVGPFAESATGFGVGMIGTVTLLAALKIAPRHLMIFALLSQTLIPWGGMGSGTLLAASYARLPAQTLGLYAAVPVALLMLVWLPLFWRTARAAGFTAGTGEHLREAGWIFGPLALLAGATIHLGPETALLAVFGPLIVVRYLLDVRPTPAALATMGRRVLPYGVVIGWLVLIRLQPDVNAAFGAVWQVRPFADLPPFAPFVHAGVWLLVGGIVTALVRRDGRSIGAEARSAWTVGRHAVMGVFLFAMLAETLAGGGVSAALAQAMTTALQAWAALATTLLTVVFGILTNSNNAGNSLFMPSQIALAVQLGLSVPAVAALQHVSGTAMGFFSPVRMSIAAGLAHGTGEERTVYRMLLPYAAVCLVLLLLAMTCVIGTAG